MVTSSETQVESLRDLMDHSGVRFGTSGARGTVQAMTDRLCFGYTLGFLTYLKSTGRLAPGDKVLVGGDRRPSTPRIMGAVARAIEHLDLQIEFAGLVPSPALALRGLEAKSPGIMVTGSHIPDDRNGMKFTTAAGEITKRDETELLLTEIEIPPLFDEDGALLVHRPLPDVDPRTAQTYLERYLKAFPQDALRGARVGVYGHSAVGRDLLVELLTRLGAKVASLGFSDRFIPVDTEAIREEDVVLARRWAVEQELDAIVSTDGDSDRPLVADENGEWLRGDVLGTLTAHFLKADAVSTPVSCNSSVERCGFFSLVHRTRIGSPFVIEGMENLRAREKRAVVGYEANGGFFTLDAFDVPWGGRLAALPTRDPIIVHLSILLLARSLGVPVSRLPSLLPARVTASDRDTQFSSSDSSRLLSRLEGMPQDEVARAFCLPQPVLIDKTDGLRLSFASGDIVHLRPSGNAPELRCYAEAEHAARAADLVRLGLSTARALSSSP